jgi:hypothetical protein
MKVLTANEANSGFGRLISLARTEQATVSKHWRSVVVVMSPEEFEPLKALDAPVTVPAAKQE